MNGEAPKPDRKIRPVRASGPVGPPTSTTPTTPVIYQKKPVQIQAIQLTDTNLGDVAYWCGGNVIDKAVQIPTLEGVMTAQLGSFVIKGVAGEFYPCDPGIFAATYELVTPSAP